ncbi:unnamed protein product, partial [Ectocarpus sp. 12 AP-2014]
GGPRRGGRRAALNLKKSKAKFEERTGKSLAEASAADNTRRAIERGSITAAQKALERTKEELAESRKSEEESKAGCSMALEFVREK